jgi:hypothetical protein
MLDKVWGTSEGLCAWCNETAQTNYVAEQAGGEVVEYQVCKPCDEERN